MFLEQHIKSETEDRCYFSVSQDGIPIKTQRTIFTESFYTIALSEMYRATSDKSYLVSNTQSLSAQTTNRLELWH